MKVSHELQDWKEPTTLEEARTQALALWGEIQSIELQLADPNRVNENKQRLSNDEYLVWQHKAKYALAMKLRVYRQLKQWIKDHRKPDPVDAGMQKHFYRLEILADTVRVLVGTQIGGVLLTPAQREAYADLCTALALITTDEKNLPIVPPENSS